KGRRDAQQRDSHTLLRSVAKRGPPMHGSRAIALCFCCILPAGGRSDDWITYEGKPGPGNGKDFVFLSGGEEYPSEEGRPMLCKILRQGHGFKCTVLVAVDPNGIINPDNQKSLPGAETLDAADAIVMLLRFRAYPDDVMKRFDYAYRRGVPIVGLRT